MTEAAACNERDLRMETWMALAFIGEAGGDFAKAVHMSAKRGCAFTVGQWAEAWQLWEEQCDRLIQQATGWLIASGGRMDDARKEADRCGVKLSSKQWEEARQRWMENERAKG